MQLAEFMMGQWMWLACLWFIGDITCTELTFTLEDRGQECYAEDVAKGTPIMLEFQVVSGGNYDVDVQLLSPDGKLIYEEKRKQYGKFNGKAEMSGMYRFCFSNKFSTFTHKVVYFDFIAGDEEQGRIPTDHATGPLTLLEASVHGIHESLDSVIDYQTHRKLGEAGDRTELLQLQRKVSYWSAAQMIIIVLVGATQVALVRSFFRR